VRASYRAAVSYEYTVIVRGRHRSASELRELVASLAPLEPTDGDDLDDGDDESGFDVRIANPGTIEISPLARGYRLSIDSNRDGNRERFIELGALMDQIAGTLGDIVDDDEATAMLEESAVSEPPPAKASVAIVTLEEVEGAPIESTSVYLDFFAQLLDPGGMPSRRPHLAKPAMMADDDYRFARGAARMTAVLHGADGAAFRRFVWKLDGYGRITGVDITELDRDAR
jgi:hypothetical protein